MSFSWAKWFAVAVLLAAPVGAFANSDHIVGVATIIDGDTIKIHDQRIRLHGVDAPESAQECRRPDGSRWRCGQQAALALQDLIDRRPVTCARQDTDRYRRIVAKCSVGGTDINVWLVTNGWAVAYRRYSSDYVGAETMARAVVLAFGPANSPCRGIGAATNGPASGFMRKGATDYPLIE